jgi:adenosylhomocysteine nucleosidase
VVVAQTGIGKVNAAMTTALLLDHFHPAQVVFTGIAGALNPDLHPGDVVIGERLAQHDLGLLTAAGMTRQGVRNPVDGTENPVFFAADSALVQLAVSAGQQAASLPIPTGQGERLPAIRPGTIATGDVFVASSAGKQSLRDGLQADAVEMEGAAVAQICYQQRVPFVVVRSISDSADETAETDLQRFYRSAAANSARLVIDLVTRLAASGSPAEAGKP